MENIVILGATGSIGTSTLELLTQFPDRFRVRLLVANRQVDKMRDWISLVQPEYVALIDPEAAALLKSTLPHGCQTQVLDTTEQVTQIIVDASTTTVVSAIVGAAGLHFTWAAIQAGKKVLLANKESLVMSGELFMAEAERSGAQILPVDSEHNAIFQCLPESIQANLERGSLTRAGIEKILLTASGGPFLHATPAQLAQVSPAQACQHPNWSMGPKISVDSATMMNKGLEYIEARWLFDAQPDQIEIVVHPESVIHSMVQFQDGSTLAQMGQADMKIPIGHCLFYPKRQATGMAALDFKQLGSLTFFEPDLKKFPNLRLAIQACNAGQAATTALNAANEIAVAAFLKGKIAFTDIAEMNETCLEEMPAMATNTLDDILWVDQRARTWVIDQIEKRVDLC
ncbi:MAG: 1-deoxy-D-xylulose-5-phosphate reductoisomerase [Shewanellaceae bacterium]|nr:1-deoxy-D-xylulose-5-phosphate reductoisomerase [Shewanellaceae bacterium]